MPRIKLTKYGRGNMKKYLRPGTIVRLTKYNENPSFFDSDGYMLSLAWEAPPLEFRVVEQQSEDAYVLEDVTRETQIRHYVWRRRDLIPSKGSSTNPNIAFLVQRARNHDR